jgi:hypothetical protein
MLKKMLVSVLLDDSARISLSYDSPTVPVVVESLPDTRRTNSIFDTCDYIATPTEETASTLTHHDVGETFTFSTS